MGNTGNGKDSNKPADKRDSNGRGPELAEHQGGGETWTIKNQLPPQPPKKK
ncbi:MAG: hypothetical protein LBC75_01130 [Fibromonadaceae bacterium]|nr:hypothetical protein [Fibromonadaceae bacterium]